MSEISAVHDNRAFTQKNYDRYNEKGRRVDKNFYSSYASWVIKSDTEDFSHFDRIWETPRKFEVKTEVEVKGADNWPDKFYYNSIHFPQRKSKSGAHLFGMTNELENMFAVVIAFHAKTSRVKMVWCQDPDDGVYKWEPFFDVGVNKLDFYTCINGVWILTDQYQNPISSPPKFDLKPL